MSQIRPLFSIHVAEEVPETKQRKEEQHPEITSSRDSYKYTQDLCSEEIVIIAAFDIERDNEIALHKKCILSHKSIHRAQIKPNALVISSASLMYIIFKVMRIFICVIAV